MKKFIGWLLAALLVVTTIVSLAACGGPNNDVDLDEDGNIIQKPDSKATKVTFWANCDSVEFEVFKTIVSNFNAKNKGSIEVKLVQKIGSDYSDALGLSLSGSNPPDVFYVGDSGYKAYAELGYLMDITELATKSKTYNIEDMWENVTERYKYDVKTGLTNTESGRFYGVPKDLGPTAIFYNEKYFEGAGITVISVDAADLDAFNNQGAADSRGKTKDQYGIKGTVKEKGYFELGGKYYFNNQVPMSWDETVACANKVQSYMRNTLGKTTGYGYFTEWWFNYGWSVGGDCIQRIPTNDPAYRGYYYDFTLMDPTPNYIVPDNVESVTVNGKTYKAGQIVEYVDKIDMTKYGKTADETVLQNNKGTYTVTSEVQQLASQGKLNVLPSQKDAFVEFVRLAASTNTTVSGDLKGYGITQMPSDIGGDSGKTNAFANGQVAMLVDGRWNVTNFRKQLGNDGWDVAPLPMYKEYDSEGNITVHGVEAGHSGSVALCISTKSKVSNAAWKFIEYCGSEEGQTLQAEAGFAIPLQKKLANSEVFLQSDKAPRNSKIFIDATEYETAGDWWYLRDKKWIDDWANVLNGDVRNGKKTMEQFYEGEEYASTFKKLISYALATK